jgi:hypothetical protein
MARTGSPKRVSTPRDDGEEAPADLSKGMFAISEYLRACEADLTGAREVSVAIAESHATSESSK